MTSSSTAWMGPCVEMRACVVGMYVRFVSIRSVFRFLRRCIAISSVRFSHTYRKLLPDSFINDLVSLHHGKSLELVADDCDTDV